MTTQFSGKASLPAAGSALVRRLVRARNDPGKDRIRMWLIDVDDTPRHSQDNSPMSALPPKADIGTQSRDVRFVPKADILHCGKKHCYSITSSASC